MSTQDIPEVVYLDAERQEYERQEYERQEMEKINYEERLEAGRNAWLKKMDQKGKRAGRLQLSSV